jgi:hypothetical protein
MKSPEAYLFEEPLPPCCHQFVNSITGSRWFDGEPEDNQEDHTICVKCGYEETEDRDE